MNDTPVVRARRAPREAQVVDMDALDVDETKSELTYSVTDTNIKALKLRPFKVIRSTIKDSLGRYVGERNTEEGGDIAYLDKETAQVYLNKNFIRVELPEDFSDDTSTGDGE